MSTLDTPTVKVFKVGSHPDHIFYLIGLENFGRTESLGSGIGLKQGKGIKVTVISRMGKFRIFICFLRHYV
jgi:hypothetical protein